MTSDGRGATAAAYPGPVSRPTIAHRVASFFGSGEGWVRPRPSSLRPDLLLALSCWALGAGVLELMRLMGALDSTDTPIWAQHLAVAVGMGLLAGRRRYPLSTAALGGLHLFVVGVTQPAVMGSMPLQICYFIVLFSGVAWARDRQQMAVVVTLVIVLMFLWVAVAMAMQSGLEEMLPPQDRRSAGWGPITPAVAAGIFVFLVNAAYFGGAVLLGQRAWLSARHTDELAQQRAQLARQSLRLRDQAVVEERLRIARELHDVVAHHVSVMGVQAAGARAVLRRDPDRAAEALRTVEDSSREAVTQLRGLLGTLRRSEPIPGYAAPAAPGAQGPTGELGASELGAGELGAGGLGAGELTPQPGLGQLAELVAETSGSGLLVSYALVDPAGVVESVPGSIGLACYRIVQESLTNVRRHSTAHVASVVARVEPGHVEVEVLDNGRPRGAHTGGSGLGHLGMRERIRSLGGSAEIGPRVVGGYRVRVRFPIVSGAQVRSGAGAAGVSGAGGRTPAGLVPAGPVGTGGPR